MTCSCCTSEIFANRQTVLMTVWDMISASGTRRVPTCCFCNALRSLTAGSKMSSVSSFDCASSDPGTSTPGGAAARNDPTEGNSQAQVRARCFHNYGHTTTMCAGSTCFLPTEHAATLDILHLQVGASLIEQALICHASLACA